MKSDEEMRRLARDVHSGAVFCSTQMREEDSGLLISVFMPLIFLDEAQREAMAQGGATVLYGYVASAVRAVNGYPCLNNMGWLTPSEWERVTMYVTAMDEALNAVVGPLGKEQRR